MNSYLSNIVTANPETAYTQSEIRDRMKSYLQKDRRTQALLQKIYNDSGIQKRHFAIQDLCEDASEFLYFHPDKGVLNPSTSVRNDLYQKEAARLFTTIGADVLERENMDAGAITHVITVSCTGFYAPGPDFGLVKALGLHPSVQRYHLGFMGCYAALPALRMADAFCRADPEANVLVVAVELCSLHFQISDSMDAILGASLFADGGAGAIVRSKPSGAKALQMNGFASTITEGGEDDMAWTIGDHGFEMILSTYVPKIIEANLEDAVKPLLNDYGLQKSGIDYWALHPGGRSIVDKAEKSLGLRPDQLAASRATLRDYGNMSSATILFVLKQLLEDSGVAKQERIYGLAFGPGLTVESGLFTKV